MWNNLTTSNQYSKMQLIPLYYHNVDTMLQGKFYGGLWDIVVHIREKREQGNDPKHRIGNEA